MNQNGDESVAVAARSLPYEDVAEIVETNVREANRYLPVGYVLLGIYNRARGVASPKGDFYVAKGPVYVLGRAASTARLDPAQAAAR